MKPHSCAVAILSLVAAFPAGAIELKSSVPELAQVKRVFVEQLGGGPASDQMRDMIIAALQNSGLFMITENAERADATIRGSADDKTFMEDHNMSDSLGVHSNFGESSASRNSMSGGVSASHNAGAGLTQTETSRIQERKHEASASLRMVNVDGDVIWSTTQESGGAKFRGAMADVADKVMHQLTADIQKARKPVADEPSVRSSPR